MRRRVHVDRELRAVARGQVLVAVVGDLLPVDARIPRRGGVGVNRHRRGLGAGGKPDAVSTAGLDVAVDQPALGVGTLSGDHMTGGAHQHGARVRLEPNRVDLLGAAMRVDPSRGRDGQRAQREQGRDRDRERDQGGF